ncbi:hypothetical protein, partial [Streptococcus dysgalactiae]
ISRPIVITIVKEKTSWINIPVCLQSEASPNLFGLAFCDSLIFHIPLGYPHLRRKNYTVLMLFLFG